MSELSVLTTSNGHSFNAYISQPTCPPKGAVIILHEIFGVTKQMQELANKFSAEGYTAVVPSLFDRVTASSVIDYDAPAKGLELVSQCSTIHLLEDIQSAIAAVGSLDVTAIGYCWGGGLAYLTACHLPIHSAVSFYGTRLLTYLSDTPTCPVQFHFAADDPNTPPDMIKQLENALPDKHAQIYVYEKVGHAFANHHRSTFDKCAADLSFARVLDLLNNRQA